jgi:hypothetical protein
LKQYQDRNEELALSLDDSERLAQRLNREKDKWMWQYEKSEQVTYKEKGIPHTMTDVNHLYFILPAYRF